MPDVPDDLKYTPEHEWVRAGDGSTVRVGITDYAQEALGDVVFVQLPDVGESITKGATIGEIESTKSVSDVFAPLTGTVTARNDQLDSQPELISVEPIQVAAPQPMQQAEVEATQIEAVLPDRPHAPPLSPPVQSTEEAALATSGNGVANTSLPLIHHGTKSNLDEVDSEAVKQEEEPLAKPLATPKSNKRAKKGVVKEAYPLEVPAIKHHKHKHQIWGLAGGSGYGSRAPYKQLNPGHR